MTKIIDLRKRSKQYYLVGKEVDQARAVSELFEGVLNDPKIYIPKLTDELVLKYDLKKEQKERIEDISERLKKARDIVQTIKSRSKKPEDFYKSFFGSNMLDKAALKTFGFAVGVYLENGDFQENVDGEARTFSELSLEEILKYNAKQINGREKFKDLRVLSFRVNAKDPYFNIELKVDGPGKTSVEKHELKHIIDSIISEKERTAEELSADLFSGALRTAGELNGLSIKANDVKKKIEKLEQRYKIMKDRNLSDSICEHTARNIASHKATLDYLQKFPFELITEAQKEGITHKDLSYIVAMTPFVKLEHRLKLIIDSFKRKKELFFNRVSEETK